MDSNEGKKRDRRHFRRLNFQPFDDEEPPFDFVTNIYRIQPTEAVLLELDEKEDSSIYDWFYDHLGLI
jgi:pre-mRNA-processing factor 8